MSASNLNNPQPTFLTKIGGFAGDGAEISAFDPESQQLFVISGGTELQILDLSDPTNPIEVGVLDVSAYGAGANSVAIKNGLVAIAVAADPATESGSVVFFDTAGTFLKSVEVGALPDMLTFTPDGTKVLVANEGEPSEDYTIDPEGSVSVIDLSAGLESATVTTADFQAFNDRKTELLSRGVRIFGLNATVAQDVEPEYISISPDGTTAFVTLQENNAIGVLDIEAAEITDVLPLGYKDHSQGQPTIEQYAFTDLPPLGMTPAGQEIKLGGLSGLFYEGTDPDTGHLKFVSVPDRGPNGAPTDVDGDGDNERPFPLPDYQARVIRFELDPNSGQIDITQTIFLTRPDGTTPITGLPNIPGVDEEPVDLLGEALPYDELGADLEGVVVAPDGTFWMVDEYRPAIYHFDANGVLIDRFVPQGTAALADQPEGTFGTETLPAEYSNRVSNRGFEAMALDTESGILYAFIQSPLANPDRDASDSSSVIRILGIDPATGDPVAEYVYLLEDADVRPGGRVDKIGDAVYAGDGKFYVIERDAAVDPSAKKFIFEIDLNGATNLLASDAPTLPAETTLEQLSFEQFPELGIQPVSKYKVTNLPSLGYLAGDKPEGLALLEDGRLAVLNDNDFGLLDEEIPIDGSVALNPDPVQLTLGLIALGSNNALDASDEDGGINIVNQPVFGMYQPDAIASFTAGGRTYYVTANEGDGRVRPTGDEEVPGVEEGDIFNEEERVEDLTLDPTAFPNAAELQAPENLGRLTVTNTLGDLDGDGDFDQLYAFGARSFSIWDEFGNLVYDSSNDFEQITAAALPEFFNSDNDENTFDTRSDAKGPEPEGVVTGTINDRTYAFVGLERIGGIMVYEVTNPEQPAFVQYINTRDFSGEAEEILGDSAPEGLTFISAADSPNGKPLLVVTYEVSGTTVVFEVNPATRISDIQGAAHVSPLEGQTVSDVPGIVTAVDSNGFYLQDPTPDNNNATSEGIFVFTGDAPAVQVGDAVQVSGTVSEFIPGGESTRNLSITQISGEVEVEVISSGNPLPEAVILGADGRTPPTEIINNDADSSNLPLEEAQQVPPVADTPATGSFSVELNGNELAIEGSFSDLTSAPLPIDGSPAHIHIGAPGTNGPIARNLTVTDNGDGSGSFSGRFTLTEEEVALVEAGELYVNLHTETNPNGELRGQVTLDGLNNSLFDPAQDGIDFYESLEGMRVTIDDALAVSPTNRFGEIFTVADNGANATGLSDRGTINISPDDFNPERIQVQFDDDLLPDFEETVNVGAQLGDVTGVVGYSFGNFEVNVTQPFTATPSTLEPEVSELVSTEDQLTVASYNVLNLDPKVEDPALTADGEDDVDDDLGSGQFDAIAAHIANNLGSPDIVGLQEIQDNNGAEITDITAADETLQLLVDKIAEISGVTYEFIDNPFIGNETNGGQPGGNIRTAFLYNPDRVSFVEGSLQTVTDPTDQQTNPENPFFDSRLPLAATFTFNGEDVTVISNHFNSKGGSAPLFGQLQPSVDLQEDPNVNGGVDVRRAQAEAVKGFVDSILAETPDANVVVLGDINEFEFISPLEILEESLTNLTETLPENERYSYIFQGNSQSLDHILVSPNLAESAEFDAVHVNSEFADQASDHDPLLTRITLNGDVEDDLLDGGANGLAVAAKRLEELAETPIAQPLVDALQTAQTTIGNLDRVLAGEPAPLTTVANLLAAELSSSSLF